MTDTVNFGRTPGYWKNHTENWDHLIPVVTTDTNFESFFGVQTSLSNSLTFEQALNLGGGGINALARHATAAYLNASVNDDSVPGIPHDNFLLWQSDVQKSTQYVLKYDQADTELLKNVFAYFNEHENGELTLNQAINNKGDSFFDSIFQQMAGGDASKVGHDESAVGTNLFYYDDLFAMSDAAVWKIIHDNILGD